MTNSTATDASTDKVEADKTLPGRPLKDEQFTTTHSVTVGSETIGYTAKTGRIVLHDDVDSKPKLAMFYTAYLRKGVAALRDRPLIFLWNGGPGSSTIWLHMYSVGPRRIVFEGDPLYDNSRWELRENDQSILDVADLVFVDAPSTGFSRVAPGEDPTQFYGIDADAAAVGDFVAEFVRREERGESPIVLHGESYGTLRTPAVAEYLQHPKGMSVDGIVLTSSIMDVAGATFGVGASANLGPVGMLPTYAATALYHGVTKGDLESVVEEAEDFALNDYSVALLKGTRLTTKEEYRIAKRVSELSGISPDYISGANLQVTLWRFHRELLRDRRRTVGRLDTRWVGLASDNVGEAFEDDPSLTMITGPATRAFNTYVRRDLGWEGDPTISYWYQRAFPSWKPRESQQNGIWTPQLEVASVLRGVINRTPQLKVLLQSGYYDVGTPYFPAELTFDQMQLEPERNANVTKNRYEAGHMMYVHEPSLVQMRTDLVQFLSTLRGGDER
jgi:carboxypeptidase C (cathepsin A)